MMDTNQFVETGLNFIRNTCSATVIYFYYSRERGFFKSARRLKRKEICHVRLDSYCPTRDENARTLLRQNIPFMLGSQRERRHAYIGHNRDELSRRGHTDREILRQMTGDGLPERLVKDYIRAARGKP